MSWLCLLEGNWVCSDNSLCLVKMSKMNYVW